MSENQPKQANQGLINCQEQLTKIPLFSRIVYFSLIFIWFTNLISSIPSQLIASSTSITFDKLYLWTILSCNFYVDSLLFLTLIIFNFHTFLPKLEERFSTLVITVKFIINGIIITLISLIFEAIFSFNQLNGVYGIWFNMLFKYCYFNHVREIKFCLFNLKINKKIYPFVLLGICILIRFQININMIVGILYALLEVKFQRIFCLMSSKNIYNKLNGIMSGVTIKCCITYGENRQGDDFSDKTMYANLQNYELGSLGSGDSLEKSANDPFSKKGVRLGDY